MRLFSNSHELGYGSWALRLRVLDLDSEFYWPGWIYFFGVDRIAELGSSKALIELRLALVRIKKTTRTADKIGAQPHKVNVPGIAQCCKEYWLLSGVPLTEAQFAVHELLMRPKPSGPKRSPQP